MKQFNKMKTTTIFLATIVAVFGGLFFLKGNTETAISPTFGGFEDSHNGTTTDSTYANSIRMIKTSSGLLHTIAVGGTSATVVELRDATSTTDIASTTLHRFAASPSTGTYLLDIKFSRGLGIVTVGSFTGNYTISYK
jgi:hypothetical protein